MPCLPVTPLADLTERPIMRGFIHTVDQFYLSVVAQEVYDDFMRRYAPVYEYQNRPTRVFVRQGPWVGPIRRALRAYWWAKGLHWRVKYPLLRRHPEVYWSPRPVWNSLKCELGGRKIHKEEEARKLEWADRWTWSRNFYPRSYRTNAETKRALITMWVRE